MKKVSLQFADILHLLEFIEFTQNHECDIDLEKIIVTCELSEADIELGINGYKASRLD